jgi:hypothetical protein
LALRSSETTLVSSKNVTSDPPASRAFERAAPFGAGRKPSQALNLPRCIFVQRGSSSDHHESDRLDPAAAPPGQEERARDRADDRAVAQHGVEAAARRAGRSAAIPLGFPQRRKRPAFEAAIRQALRADARRPRRKGRTARALRADANDAARVMWESHGSAVGAGAAKVIGRAVVIHRDPDDDANQPAGNSGPRFACGVIVAGK